MGAKWQRIRSILNPRMLKPKHVSSYANTINDVVTDFTVRVAKLREASGDGVVVNDLAGELYKFAFEGKLNEMFLLWKLFFNTPRSYSSPQSTSAFSWIHVMKLNWPKVFISVMQHGDRW